MGQLDWPIDIATAVSTGSLPGTCRMPYYGKDVGSHVLQGTLLAEDAHKSYLKFISYWAQFFGRLSPAMHRASHKAQAIS